MSVHRKKEGDRIRKRGEVNTQKISRTGEGIEVLLKIGVIMVKPDAGKKGALRRTEIDPAASRKK